MQLTFRGTLLLLFAAPWLLLGTWVPVLQWGALAYLLLCVVLLALDYRLAEGPRRFEATREHDIKLSLGAQNPVRLLIHTRGRRPARFWVRDEPPDDFGIDTRTLTGSAGPHQGWQGRYHVLPLRRGDYAFGNLNLRWLSPLGLVRRQGIVAPASPVKVYPNLLEVRRYDLLLRQNRLQELGLRHARLLGTGTEFERLREYLPDDEYRRINWKASAKRHRPVTVQYQTERSQTVIAVLDTG